jgi:hypothetical protein
MISIPLLTKALQAIGNAQVFVGDPFASGGGGMVAIGAKEGEISVEVDEEYNDLTAPELTGPAVHQRTVMGVSVRITVPVIAGETDLYPITSPLGQSGGGVSYPLPVVPTSVLVIPNLEVGGGLANATGATSGWVRTAGAGAAAATEAAAAPKHAVWLWRAAPERPSRSFSYENGGKQIWNVTFQSMFDGDRPEGHKVYTVGDPTAQGITTIRL